jgi:hypothetical protein
MKIKNILKDLLQGMPEAEAARKAKIQRSRMHILLQRDHSKRAAVRFETMGKIWDAFGWRPGDWLVTDSGALSVLVAGLGGRLHIVVGEHQVYLARKRGFEASPHPANIARRAIDLYDTKAVVEVARRSVGTPVIETCGYSLHLPEQQVLEGRGLTEDLRTLTSGVRISFGSPLSSAYADFILARIQDEFRHVPITFHWGCAGEGSRAYSKFGKTKQGIEWGGHLFGVADWQSIASLQRGESFDDLAVIVLQRVAQGDKKALVILALGYRGPSSYACASFLNSTIFKKLSSEYLKLVSRTEKPAPHFSLWKVPCTKGATQFDIVPGPLEPIDSLGPKEY